MRIAVACVGLGVNLAAILLGLWVLLVDHGLWQRLVIPLCFLLLLAVVLVSFADYWRGR